MSPLTKFLWWIKPIVICIDEGLTIEATIKKITGDHYYKWRGRIKPGYVFLTSAKGHGSNWINPSKLSHGAIYFGENLRRMINLRIPFADLDESIRLVEFLEANPNIDDSICYVLEATAKGVIATNLVKFLTTKDVIKIFKPSFDAPNVELRAVRFLGQEYDYGFTDNNDSKYCFELVAKSYEAVSNVQLKKTHYKLLCMEAHNVYTSNTFEDLDNWECVIDSTAD